jgi:hypothetical protein
MTVDVFSQAAALTGDALPCKTNPPRHFLVLENDAGIQVDAVEERIFAWQALLASNQPRKLQSAKHRLLFGRRM